MRRAAIVAGTMMVMLLAACGGGDDGETTSAAGDTPSGGEATTAEGTDSSEAKPGVPSDDPWCTAFISWAEEFQSVITSASGGGAPDTTAFMDLTASVKEGAPAEISADVTIVMDNMSLMVEALTGSPGAIPTDAETLGAATTRVITFMTDHCGLNPDFPMEGLPLPPSG